MSRTIVFCLSFLLLALGQVAGNSIDEGLRELSKLSKALQNPMLDDKQIGSMIRVDKIPTDEALRDLSAIVKLMVVEHQLTLQSLRVISIALEKLSKKVRSQGRQDGTLQEDLPAEEEEMSHAMTKRSVLERFRRQAEEAAPSSSVETSEAENLPKSRQKRWFFGGLGLLGLSSLYSPWGWGGYPYYYNNYYYPYSNGYYYPYYYSYYPYYYTPMRAATPAAALRTAAKNASKDKLNVTESSQDVA